MSDRLCWRCEDRGCPRCTCEHGVFLGARCEQCRAAVVTAPPDDRAAVPRAKSSAATARRNWCPECLDHTLPWCGHSTQPARQPCIAQVPVSLVLDDFAGPTPQMFPCLKSGDHETHLAHVEWTDADD